jgi:ADP-dependent NAD(P)H-hydrate dehydratase / NAD(P)H-hydrate epimerase
MKLFTASQIAGIDRYTIANEPIADIDLMERAATELYHRLRTRIDTSLPVQFFAGPGNNGGDALALARMFAEGCNECTVYLLDSGKPLSGSPAINWQRLVDQGRATLCAISSEEDFPLLHPDVPVIDGLFGSGLNRPLSGLAAALVKHINSAHCRVYAIDVPSGLAGEDNTGNQADHIIMATLTLTLQFPKLSLLFPENGQFTGELEVVDIGLHPGGIAAVETPYHITGLSWVRNRLPERPKFSHKGTYGHALLIAGSFGKMGAAVLAAGGCLRAGVGLLTAHIPEKGYIVMQTAVPEVMCSVDKSDTFFSSPPAIERFSAVGIGPGMGTDQATKSAYFKLLQEIKVPLVADADGLNLLAGVPGMLPAGSVITPHPVEFMRLFGETTNSWQRLQLLREMAQKYKIVVVLKGAYTQTALPTGEVYFNPTGNPGMATAGSGDVLTGIILSFLAQGLPPGDAAICGVYLHGLAGDLASGKFSQSSLIASDISLFLGNAFLKIYDTGNKIFDIFDVSP